MPVSLLRRARVVALDSDQAPVELLGRACAPRATSGCLALTMNVSNSSPGLARRKRRRLLSRGRPELVLGLALVDDVTITANVPLRAWIVWLAVLGAWLVIEFPAREDPGMLWLLVARREGTRADFERAAFGRCLGDVFEVECFESLASATRVLYRGRPAVA